MKTYHFYSFIIFSLIFISCNTNHPESNTFIKPNVVYILADDLGYGDLSCFGQEKFETPNIDQLSREGIIFTQHYAGCTVCAPSRSSLMTGMDTGHTPIRGNITPREEGQWPLPAKSYTMAEMFKSAGYVTGAFGKWGLGFIDTEGDPNAQGFDNFYGYNCQGLAHNYFPGHLWDDHKKIEFPGNDEDKFEQYAPDYIHEKALKFIEQNKDTSFFMYYPTTIPHAELLLPEKYLKKYRGKFLPEKIYKGTKYGDDRFRTGAYGYQEESHAAFAAMVTLLDKQVGEIMDKLKEYGIDKNTIVVFSSDNGPHLEGGADPDYFNSNAQFKGFKRDLYEGGIRVPMFVRWPGKIEAGTETNHISAFWDMLPTFSDILGIDTPENIQGISLLNTLLGKDGQEQHGYLYWEFHELNGRQAIRKGPWKYISYNVFIPDEKTIELYNLEMDQGEENNVAEQFPEIVKEMQELIKQSRIPSKPFPFYNDAKQN